MKMLKILFAALFFCGLFWQSCQKDEEPDYLHEDAEEVIIKTDEEVVDCSIVCIDPEDPAYFEITQQVTVTWGNPRNPHAKTVEIVYYNTLEAFIVKVTSSEDIANLLIDEVSYKEFSNPIPAGTWYELDLPLPEGWEGCDEYTFEFSVIGSGPPAVFDVVYELVGECIYYTLDLAVYPEGAGTVTGAGEYMEGEEVQIKAIANEGWEFVNWTDEDVNNFISYEADFAFTMPAEDVTLRANFDALFELTLNVNPENTGTVNGAGEYKKDEEVQLTATANEGYVFVNWTDEDNTEISVDAEFTYSMPNYDISLTANFEEEQPVFTNCGDDITFTYFGEDVTYGTVVGANDRCWLDRNLGASQVATSSTDAASFGDLFQWGRAADGHQIRNSSTTTTLSSSDSPGHGNFILAPSLPYDWRNPQNHDLWQGVDGANNPCPPGWRVPTEAEWIDERNSWGFPPNAYFAFTSPLKLPAAGKRYYNNGLIVLQYNIDVLGLYWSSTVAGTSSPLLYFTPYGAEMTNRVRAYGYSVRCIKD